MAKGNFIEYVVSDNPNKYPNGGEQGGYYWELYGKPKTLISFTISGTSYQAEEGMTWGEWVESSYNTGGYVKMGSHIYSENIGLGVGTTVTNNVRLEDVIIAGYTYSNTSGGSGL